MNIFGWTIIRSRNFVECKENERLLLERIALLEEHRRLEHQIEDLKQKAKTMATVGFLHKQPESKWMN